MLPTGAISQFNPLDDETLEIKGDEIELAKELSDAFFITFTTPHGKKVLDHLVNLYLSRPVARQGDDMVTIGIRQGRSDLVMQILNEIRRSQKWGEQ